MLKDPKTLDMPHTDDREPMLWQEVAKFMPAGNSGKKTVQKSKQGHFKNIIAEQEGSNKIREASCKKDMGATVGNQKALSSLGFISTILCALKPHRNNFLNISK